MGKRAKGNSAPARVNVKESGKPKYGVSPAKLAEAADRVRARVSQAVPVADSMKSAAALTGYSEALLKVAKEKGCNAFEHSRVDIFKLEEWLAIHPEIKEEEE